MRYILSEMKEKNRTPIKAFENNIFQNSKTISGTGKRRIKSEDFNIFPNIKNEIKSYNSKEKLDIEINPNKDSSNKTKEFLKSYTSNLYNGIKRKLLFTEPELQNNLNKTARHHRFKSQNISYKPIEKNIIEYINNGKEMINFLPDNYYRLINDKFQYEKWLMYKNTIKIFEEKIKKYEISNIISLTQGFKIKKFEDDNIFLTLKSIQIKIINKKTNEKEELFLPFNILPFYYGYSFNQFVLFLTLIIKITNENKIEFLTNLIKDLIIEISKTFELFKENSLFFDNRSQEIKKFPFLFNSNHYSLIIIPPKIELKKTKGAKVIKLAGKGLLIYLLEKIFLKWDTATLCYLSSLKSFRNEVHYIFQIKQNENIINIENENNIKILYKGKMNLESIDNKREFSFFIQLKKENKKELFFMYFHPYIIEIIYYDIIKKYYLTFKEMKFLYNLIKKGYKLENIIHKCIIINEINKNIYFSLDILKGYDIQKYDKFFYEWRNDNKLSKKLKLNIHQPFLEWKQFNDYNTLNYINLLEYNFPLPNNLFISLVTSKFEIWPKLLNEYSEDIFSLINETNNKRRVHGLNTTGNIVVRKNTSRRKTNKNKYSSKIICKIQFDN